MRGKRCKENLGKKVKKKSRQWKTNHSLFFPHAHFLPVEKNIKDPQRQSSSTHHRATPLWSTTEKKHRKNSHLIIHCPTSEEVSERVNEQSE